MQKRILINKLLILFRHKQKIIRIDDYPSGIRPVLKDQTPLFKILDEFEKRQIYFHLAIVPKELDEFFDERILKYKYLIPVMHGYDHKYDYYSKILIDNNDIYNQHTIVDQFDEFKDNSIAEITSKLQSGKDIIYKYFKRNVDIYVPPCNILNKNTKKALITLGFKSVLSEKYFFSRKLKWIPSDYYGTLNNMPFKKYTCISIHLTWEYDTLRTKGMDLITKKLDYIQKEWNN